MNKVSKASIAAVVIALTVVMGLLCAKTGGLQAPAAQQNKEPAEFVWDFTKGSDAQVVAWPADVSGTLWRFDDHATITLITPDGRHSNFEAYSFQVRRTGRSVTSILISMQNEDSSAAYERAKSLIRDWRIASRPLPPGATDPLRKLDQWYAAFKPGGTGKGVRMCEIGRNDLSLQPGVLIRSSYDEKAPWFVALALGGLDKRPVTMPATEPTQDSGARKAYTPQ